MDEGVGALLVENEEYRSTLKWGQVDTLVPKIQKSVQNEQNHLHRTLRMKSLMKSNQDKLQKAHPHLQ